MAKLQRSLCAGLIAGVAFAGSAEAGSSTSPHDDPFNGPAQSSEPSAGAVIGTILTVVVGAALLGGLLSGDDSSPSENSTSASREPRQTQPVEDDSEAEPLTGGLYGNCHGGSLYGCP